MLPRTLHTEAPDRDMMTERSAPCCEPFLLTRCLSSPPPPGSHLRLPSVALISQHLAQEPVYLDTQEVHQFSANELSTYHTLVVFISHHPHLLTQQEEEGPSDPCFERRIGDLKSETTQASSQNEQMADPQCKPVSCGPSSWHPALHPRSGLAASRRHHTQC